MRTRFYVLMNEAGAEGGSGGAPAAAPQSQAPAPSVPAATVQTNDFRSQLGEFANDDTFKTFNDVQTLAKSYKHAASMVGRDKAVVPTKNSAPEEFRQYFQKVGLPESRDKYDAKLEGLTDDSKKALLDLAYEKNMLPEQVETMVDFFKKQEEAQQAKTVEQYKTELNTTVESLKQEYGDAFSHKIQQAQAVAKHIGGQELLDHLDQTGIGNDPMLIRSFIKLAELMKREDSFDANTVQRFTMTKGEASKEINKIVGDMRSPYYNRDHAEHKDYLAKMISLQEIASQE